jgi:C4-dicarboxylate-specific signal transduction histidine kinase
MNVATVIEQALETHRTKLQDMGATVVWQGGPGEIEVGSCGEEVGQALSEMIDGALHAVGTGEERRLVVWARNAHCGVIVGVEYRGGGAEETQRTPALPPSQEDRALQSLAESRRLLERCGGRIFVHAFECGSVRFVMELPDQTCELH